MPPVRPAVEPPHFTITVGQFTELTDLAEKLRSEAERCREAGRWSAALMMLGGSMEAVLLATTCVFEPELRMTGLWKPPQGDPTRWTLGHLAGIARKAGWLPVQPPGTRSPEPGDTGDGIFADLDGQAGDALKFAERLRNMIVHPGAYIREPLRPDIDDDEHMRQTYDLIDGIHAHVIDHMTRQLRTLPG